MARNSASRKATISERKRMARFSVIKRHGRFDSKAYLDLLWSLLNAEVNVLKKRKYERHIIILWANNEYPVETILCRYGHFRLRRKSVGPAFWPTGRCSA